jgi:methylthioribose-1-phosphate isomerase
MPEIPLALCWEGDQDGRLIILEQTLLPAEEREVTLETVADVADAIRRLAVRGAPAIGVTAAYGMVVSARSVPPRCERGDAVALLRRDRELLASTRPTAVNLAWALDRMAQTWEQCPMAESLPAVLLAEAIAIHEEDRQACLAMAGFAAALVRDGGSYLTHCNAGSLATGGIGTALGVFHLAAREGKRFTVFADETRPLLQGARLTAWELQKSGIDVVLICDSAAATFLSRGPIEAVIVGADRIAANGDTANKLGTFPTALAARHSGIPFYVIAPTSTFDLELPDGGQIPIEERAPEEVVRAFGRQIAPEGIGVRNPAFDVTPAELITGIITERGIIRSPSTESVRAILG